MRTPAGVVLALTFGLAGCPDRTISEVTPDQKKVESKDIPVNINRDIDILFLIDKSPTMLDEQASLTANFPRFMQVLSQIEGGLPNVHVGVISQDIGAGGMSIPAGGCSGAGDNGNLLATPRISGCSPPNGNYISDIDPGGGAPRIKNYSGTLEDTFSCIATLGSAGCGFEQHLGSLQKALVGNSANQGFLRPNAFLAIVIISDEDDCSYKNAKIYDPNPSFTAELGPFADYRCFEWGWECDEGTMGRTARTYNNCRPRTNSPYLKHPDEFVQAIKGLKADPKNIIVSAIIGPSAQTDPARPDTQVMVNSEGNPAVLASCTRGAQNAFPMPRIWHFAQQFPERNTFYSLCEEDLGKGLALIAEKIRAVVGNPCFESAVDTTDIDPNNPGLQLQCTVSDVSDPGTTMAKETIMPPCKMSNDTTPAADAKQPCWYVKPDTMRCSNYPTKLTLAVHPEQRNTAPNTHLIAQCIVNE